jgi:tRNA threonylcarbamoyladenosine biosynthesis protein TsaE
MGIRDYFGADTLCLVEWPEKGEGWLPSPDLEITLTYVHEQREALIVARTAIGEAILERLSSQCA